MKIMKALKYILVDDNEQFRCALSTVLITKFNAEILDEAANADEALKIKTWHLADIIFIDVFIPGKDGIQLAKELLWHNNNLKIIAITMHIEKVYLLKLIEAGFRGCIFKHDLVAQLNEAIDNVIGGGLFFPKDILFDRSNQMKL